MAVSIVRGPDGRQHEVQHPDGIAPSQIIKYAQQQIASASNAEDAFVVDVGKGLFAGGSQAAVSSAAGVTQWMGQSFGSDSLLQAAEDMRQYGQGIAEDIGLDEDFRQSFFGQVVQGLGQVPVTIGAGAAGLALAGPAGMIGAAAITTGGQMSSEFLTDMEGTLGKGYTDFNPEEKANALTGMLAQTALGTALETVAVGKALKPLLRKLKTTGVSGKVLKKAIGKDRNALRELVEAAGAEGLTEAAQGQSLDTLASMLYDEERELITMDTLKRRAMEFGVGAVVGGTVSGGAQILGNPEKASTTKKDLKKPVSERAGLEVPRTAEVQYKELDGQVRIVPIALGKDEDPITAAEEALRGRYDEKYGITITEVTAPQPLDVVIGEPGVEPDVTTEEVPVQPEAAGSSQGLSAGEIVVLNNLGKNNVFFDDKPRNAENLLLFLDEQPQLVPDEMRNNIRARLERLSALDKSVENLSAEEIYNKGIALFEGGDFSKREDGAHLLNELDKKDPEGYTAAEEKAKQQAAVEPVVEPTPEAIEDDAFPALPEQSARTQLEFDPFADPEPEQEELFLPSRSDFRISPRMAKSTPRWRGAEVNYSSDLELASYIASGKGKNAGSVRSELIEAGYSPAEIDSMGKDVRSQMRKQYNAGRPISVKIGPDVTAEASGVDRRTMSFKDVTKRTPEIQEQAKILKANIKAGDREQSRAVAQAADEFKPVHAYDFVPAPETNSEMRIALNKKQLSKMNAAVPDGKQVAMRLDIPAYRDYGTWVPVIHEPKGNSFQAGNALSYQSTAVLDNVQLGVAGKNGLAALNIATGKDKSTIATIKGTYKRLPLLKLRRWPTRPSKIRLTYR